MFSLIKVAIALLKLYEKEIIGLDIMGISDLFRFIKSEKYIKNPKLSDDESSIIFMAKEADIEQLLKIAQKIRLPAEKIAEYSKTFKEKDCNKLNPVALDFYAEYQKKLVDTESQKLFQREIELAVLGYALRIELGDKAVSEPPKSQLNFEEMRDPSLILKDLDVIEEAEDELPEGQEPDDQASGDDEEEESQEYEDNINLQDNCEYQDSMKDRLGRDSNAGSGSGEGMSVQPDLVDGRTLFGNSQKASENSFDGRALPQLRLSLISNGSDKIAVMHYRKQPSNKIKLYLG